MPQFGSEARERLRHQTIKVALELEHDVAWRLRRAAAARDVPLDYLLRSVLDVVARDKLVDAVLDDGDLPGA